MDKPYVYERLRRAGQIRLLCLQPGTLDNDIHFTLVSVNLHENPEYEAISYCWGDPTDVKTVYCNGKTIQVTTSLYTALRRFRKPDEERTLWADAVCINQKDNAEKTEQVKLMHRIYSQPSHILIWLGDDMTGLDGLKESIQGALEVLPPSSEDTEFLQRVSKEMFREASRLRKEKKPNFNDHNWAPINYVFCRPWFNRRWIIQEVAMAPEHVPRTCICGEIEFSWTDLADIAYRIGSHGLGSSIAGLSVINYYSPTMWSFFLENGRPFLSLTSTFMAMLIKRYQGTSNLVDAITATATFKATDGRDHLYSLLNLTPFNSDLQPDYTVTPSQACMRFALATLRKDKNLRVLSLAPHTFVGVGDVVANRLPGLPSWVPDLTCQGGVNPMVSYTIRKQLFHAGGPDVFADVSKDNTRLHLRGCIVDTIAAVTTANIDVPFPSEEDILPKTHISARVKMRVRNWLRECRDLAAFPKSWTDRLHDDNFRKEFAETVLCGMTGMRDALPPDLLPYVEMYMGYVFDYFEEGYKLTEELREAMLTYGALIESSTTGMVEARRFCRTEGGRLGQVRKEAQVGDSVCVIFGAEVPYVIRPIEAEDHGGEGVRCYRLIGDAFVHGVMQGEALVDEKYETVDITLV
ncbi:heterokaryon incompatibility protein-domain-containing protein [Apodospora peruviana]|uniref:Heterokaryon incompatibility protein-domain-containing protein n=1 Tax=Apodospora peruviana TaxID=516989 RepID=A0AAE0HW53_9PEZI|nr:heterokaryon incompatibility protein-domain-containing protein [Apodospora peruviana]